MGVRLLTTSDWVSGDWANNSHNDTQGLRMIIALEPLSLVMTAWHTSLLFAHCCCGDQLTVAGETETSAIVFPFKWKYWQGLVRVSAPLLPRECSEAHWQLS